MSYVLLEGIDVERNGPQQDICIASSLALNRTSICSRFLFEHRDSESEIASPQATGVISTAVLAESDRGAVFESATVIDCVTKMTSSLPSWTCHV